MFALLMAILSSVAASLPLDDGIKAARSGDHAKAMALWLPLAENGNPVAQYLVAECYEHGQGVTQDLRQAAKWYRSSAEQHYPRAQYRLGLLLRTGRGVEQDHPSANNWFHLAATSMWAPALYALGETYLDGLGVLQDKVAAYTWFELASSVPGYDADVLNRALTARDKLAPTMSPEEIDTARRRAAAWRQSVNEAACKIDPALETARNRYGIDLSREIARDQSYPFDARWQGRQGQVTLLVGIGTDGKVKSVTVAASSGHMDLDQAAVDKVKRIKRTPVPPDDLRDKEFTLTIPIVFRLE